MPPGTLAARSFPQLSMLEDNPLTSPRGKTLQKAPVNNSEETVNREKAATGEGGSGTGGGRRERGKRPSIPQ